MDHLTSATTTEPASGQAPSPRSYTLRIPRPNWQVTALILIAIIAAFQTIQLVRLKGNVTTKAATTTSPTSSSSSSSDSGLQSQVGGC